MEISAIRGYHAHIYYTPETRGDAERLRAEMERRWPSARYGRWHDKPVGPHPSAMYQVAFAPELFAELAPWLILNKGPLTVFLHPETGKDHTDHAQRAVWMGASQTLDLSQLSDD
ncbi:MAG TPA: DOPA 4,5-dioxygenase family protein [Beijerinckiaceae bacterium]|jgi:DOPA 4,5-dioxygenase